MGLLLMRSAENRLDYEAGWEASVMALNLVWHRFYEEGRRHFGGPFLEWAAKYKATQLSDPLLQYLAEARNQITHGKTGLLLWGDPTVHLGSSDFEVFIKDLKIYQDFTVTCTLSSTADIDRLATPIRFDMGSPSLPTIENRKDKKNPKVVPPPRAHLNKEIEDGSPDSIIELGHTYYKSMMEAAIHRFSPEQTPK